MSGIGKSSVNNFTENKLEKDLFKMTDFDDKQNEIRITENIIKDHQPVKDKTSISLDFKTSNNYVSEFIGIFKEEEHTPAIDKLMKVYNVPKNIYAIDIINKNNLYKGETEIKYRFKTDIDKSTFKFVEKSPEDYGKNKDFFYVNGINTKNDEANYTAKELSNVTGQNVKTIYNPTSGMFKDLLEAANQRFKDNNFDDITKKTAVNFYETLSSGKNLKIVAHSQGAAITSDALKLCEEMLLNSESWKIMKSNPDISVYKLLKESRKEVNQIMSNIEVITLGGASSQEKFPNIKLVEVINPKDPVPKIAGTDPLETVFSRKTSSVGKVSYVKNPEKLEKIIKYNDYTAPNTQNILGGFKNTLITIPKAIYEGVINRKSIIDYHTVTDGENAYLNQSNVRSLLYNFGRQDFSIVK